MKIFALIISALFVNNFVLSRFLGICSFLGVSKKVETATGMGLAVTFVMALASLISYIVYHAILVPLNITYLLVIAALVQFVEMVIKKKSPGLYKALGIFLPLITTNCAILGAVIINMNDKLNLLESLIFGVFSGLGYMLAIVLLAGLRERMEACDKMPKAMEGLPISLITAGLMAMAFLGFQGLLH